MNFHLLLIMMVCDSFVKFCWCRIIISLNTLIEFYVKLTTSSFLIILFIPITLIFSSSSSLANLVGLLSKIIIFLSSSSELPIQSCCDSTHNWKTGDECRFFIILYTYYPCIRVTFWYLVLNMV